MTPARTFGGIGTVVLALLTAAQVAFAAAPPLRFLAAPARVAQGGHVQVTVAVRPASARCTLGVRYANGAHQAGVGAASAVAGKVSWAWDVPVGAAIGRGVMTVHCAGAGTRTHPLLVVGAEAPVM